jgi:hypothetical protein
MSGMSKKIKKPFREAKDAVKETFVPSKNSGAASAAAFNYAGDWHGANLEKELQV